MYLHETIEFNLEHKHYMSILLHLKLVYTISAKLLHEPVSLLSNQVIFFWTELDITLLD